MAVLGRSRKIFLNRVLVQDPETGILINADYRISESAWLKPTGNGEENDKIIQKYRKRISMITGLTMERAEDVQLGNDLIYSFRSDSPVPSP